MPVTYGVHWNNAAPAAGTSCSFTAIPVIASVASGVISAMQGMGHIQRFVRGNENAWATDYEHPEVASTGQSLTSDGIDSVALMYYAGHGLPEVSASLASDHFGCRAFYSNMRLGVRELRWLVLDLCGGVAGPDVSSSVNMVWSEPTNGDSARPLEALHVLCTFIDESFAGFDTGRGGEFATFVSHGAPVGSAWLDAAFARSGAQTNKPIAIACGADEADARFRLDNGRLADGAGGPVPSRSLAWKWRS
jgi:hypothetical protein